MVDRPSLVDPNLLVRVAAADAQARREVARAVALAAIEHVGLAEPRITDALDALNAGQVGEIPQRAALSELVDELDNIAFDAQDALDDGTCSEEDYDEAFFKARAATALLSAFEEDTETAAADAIDEAYQAFDEDLAAISDAIESNL